MITSMSDRVTVVRFQPFQMRTWVGLTMTAPLPSRSRINAVGIVTPATPIVSAMPTGPIVRVVASAAFWAARKATKVKPTAAKG
jgi:hypothetical protein